MADPDSEMGGKELGDELYIAFCMWDPSFLIVHN